MLRGCGNLVLPLMQSKPTRCVSVGPPWSCGPLHEVDIDLPFGSHPCSPRCDETALSPSMGPGTFNADRCPPRTRPPCGFRSAANTGSNAGGGLGRRLKAPETRCREAVSCAASGQGWPPSDSTRLPPALDPRVRNRPRKPGRAQVLRGRHGPPSSPFALG
jgi:hypothetical protein